LTSRRQVAADFTRADRRRDRGIRVRAGRWAPAGQNMVSVFAKVSGIGSMTSQIP
jgi:hypothetical protein